MKRSPGCFVRGASSVRHTASTLLCSTAVLALQGCALVELSGKMTRTTGEVMTEYSKEENSGFIGRLAGFGGRVNTAVGSTVEGIGKKGKEGGETPGFVDANKQVLTSAIGAAREPSAAPAQKSAPSTDATGKQAALSRPSVADPSLISIADMQAKLIELGYQPGAADGVMGKRSVEALQKFQNDSGLAVTGRLDFATAEKLRAARTGKKRDS